MAVASLPADELGMTNGLGFPAAAASVNSAQRIYSKFSLHKVSVFGVGFIKVVLRSIRSVCQHW